MFTANRLVKRDNLLHLPILGASWSSLNDWLGSTVLGVPETFYVQC